MSVAAAARATRGTALSKGQAGRYSNPALAALIDAVHTEPDLTRRRVRVGAALRWVKVGCGKTA